MGQLKHSPQNGGSSAVCRRVSCSALCCSLHTMLLYATSLTSNAPLSMQQQGGRARGRQVYLGGYATEVRRRLLRQTLRDPAVRPRWSAHW